MFKDKLKELRIQKGISQYELAEKLFVSRSAIAKWENGNGIPSDVNLEAICEFFGVEEEWLLDRKDIKKMVENLDKKNSKVLWFVLGIVIPVVLFILSIFPMFSYVGMITVVIYPKSILTYMNEISIIIPIFVLMIYLYEFVFSFFYKKINMKYGKLIQILNISMSIICFIIIFIIAYNMSIDEAMNVFLYGIQ